MYWYAMEISQPETSGYSSHWETREVFIRAHSAKDALTCFKQSGRDLSPLKARIMSIRCVENVPAFEKRTPGQMVWNEHLATSYD